jgi:hypothetical protein
LQDGEDSRHDTAMGLYLADWIAYRIARIDFVGKLMLDK